MITIYAMSGTRQRAVLDVGVIRISVTVYISLMHSFITLLLHFSCHSGEALKLHLQTRRIYYVKIEIHNTLVAIRDGTRILTLFRDERGATGKYVKTTYSDTEN
jgi:hypothetical protein